MGVLLSRLLIVLNDSDVDSTDYHIAYFLLMNYYQLANMTISDIARKCHVSVSTISKFIRKIDFEDFSDFRDEIPFKENPYNVPYSYNQNILEYLENNNFDQYLQTIHQDIEALKEIKGIKELALDLHKYKKVASFGLYFSQIGALDLQLKLAYNGKFIITYLNDVKQEEFIKASDEDTLIIIYSNSGDFLEKNVRSKFKRIKDYSKVKGKIVLITGNEAVKKKNLADLYIIYKQHSSITTHSVLYPLINDLIALEYRKVSK